MSITSAFISLHKLVGKKALRFAALSTSVTLLILLLECPILAQNWKNSMAIDSTAEILGIVEIVVKILLALFTFATFISIVLAARLNFRGEKAFSAYAPPLLGSFLGVMASLSWVLLIEADLFIVVLIGFNAILFFDTLLRDWTDSSFD